MAGMRLTDGIHLSLAGLRGYMILGKDPVKGALFKAERQRGWDQIDLAVQEMNEFAKNWTDSNNITRLNEMKGFIEEFRLSQEEVENISHSPDNIPAVKMLLTEAAPQAAIIVASITTMIDEESALPATPERKNC